MGDRLYTDIAVADGSQVTSILVMSGETTPELLTQSAIQPDLVVRDLDTSLPICSADFQYKQKRRSELMKKGGYLDLFLTFARIGGLTFGGGYAMLPMLQKEVVENRGWATEEELLDYYAVGQCTPGIIAVNVATFIGHKEKRNF